MKWKAKMNEENRPERNSNEMLMCENENEMTDDNETMKWPINVQWQYSMYYNAFYSNENEKKK